MVAQCVFQELLDILFCANWCPQYCKALLLGWASPVADPSVRAQRVSVCWSVAAAVPDSGFALVEADVGMCCEVVG